MEFGAGLGHIWANRPCHSIAGVDVAVQADGKIVMAGIDDSHTIEDFIRRHHLDGNYAVFARDLEGKPWYSLVYGDYPDRDAALRARADLPAGLRAIKAWPRSFASVQEKLPADADSR